MADGSADSAGDRPRFPVVPLAAAPTAEISNPGTVLGEEIAAARSYRAQAKAANTIRAYTSDWNQFEGWCDERSLDPLPARPEAVATYLASLALAGKADSTIGRHLAAIGWKHRQDGLVAPVPVADKPRHRRSSHPFRASATTKSASNSAPCSNCQSNSGPMGREQFGSAGSPDLSRRLNNIVLRAMPAASA
jgi:hypothetical protein